MNILLIKLGALGDVLRTTPLLTALKREYPRSSLTWVVDRAHEEVLKGNLLIDRLKEISDATVEWVQTQYFDLALCLDKEAEATHLMAMANATKKMGFTQDERGALSAADPRSDYALRLGLDDELKFRQNRKTYQEISFEQAGLEFRGEEYVFPANEAAAAAAASHLKSLKVNPNALKHPVIGLNTGSGARFAGKKLPVETVARLAEQFHEKMGGTIFLLGGPEELVRNAAIQTLARCPVVSTGSHPISVFAEIVKLCDMVLTGDTTAMHVAIAVKTPVLAYFASTCAQEIEMYGRGRKIVSEIECAPCYKKDCPIDEQCMKDMRVDRIFHEAEILLGRDHATSVS